MLRIKNLCNGAYDCKSSRKDLTEEFGGKSLGLKLLIASKSPPRPKRLRSSLTNDEDESNDDEEIYLGRV